MFSFIRKYAETLGGVDIYGDVALVVFVVVFLSMVWFAIKADKNYIQELEKIPFN